MNLPRSRSTLHASPSTKDALLEIGSEELPASFIAPGMRQLESLAEESLKASELPFASIDVFGTPRRLAVVIHGLADRSPDQKKVVSGPPAAIAKDAQGQWTAAALGFARKQGLKPSELTIENDKLIATIHIKGVATRQLLGDLFPQWISKLEFPKSMVWEQDHFRYPRPIRWIAALYGSDLVSFSLAGVRSTRWTLGIGPWAPKKIPVSQAGKYALLLKDQCVLVDPTGRREAIQRFADQAVKRAHGKLHLSAPLLEQVANLVEHPVAILGNFDPAYLDLPKEVLITCLEHHQKYFPVEQATGGKLLPQFVGIRNGISVNQEVVREGYERVLAARLADARFFFNQDHKTSLASKVESLNGVVFQKDLGTVFAKKERIKDLLTKMSGYKESSGKAPAFPLEPALRIAELCKADLVTDMVREFPELQGAMGRIYASADGETDVVSDGIEQHYWPITLSSALPGSDVAAAVSLADKIDTLAGDFAVGIEPSGSADPYGLRRASAGVLRILETKCWMIPVEELIDLARSVFPESIMSQRGIAREHLCQFMRQRLAAILEERGFRFDEIDAVLAKEMGVIPDMLHRLLALHDIRKEKEFEPLAVAFKRSMNIVRQASKATVSYMALFDGDAQIHNELLREPAEIELFETLEKVREEVSKFSSEGAYQKALNSMVPLRVPLDLFFEKVMVMVEDEALRSNRLAIMRRLAHTICQIADFSKLQNA